MMMMMFVITLVRKTKLVKFRKFSFIRGGPEFLNFECFFLVTIFVLKTSKNAMKDMTLSIKMKGEVISDHFLMLWFQKDSLDRVAFRTFRTIRGGPGFLNKIVDFCGSK